MYKSLATIMVFCSISAPTLLANASDKAQAVYLNVGSQNNGRFEVKFIFTKAGAGVREYSPTEAFFVIPDLPRGSCQFKLTDDFSLAPVAASAPVYDFTDKAMALPTEKLPIFFAILVSAELGRRGLVKAESESLPYHMCTRLFWEKRLGLK